MPLLFTVLGTFVVGLCIPVAYAALVRRTSIEEMNCLFSLDENDLLDKDPMREPRRPGLLLGFSTKGDHIRCDYRNWYEGEASTQIVTITVLSTKARLCVWFEGESLSYFTFKDCPIASPDMYFNEGCFPRIGRTKLFIAHRALTLAQHIAAKRFPEAQPV